MDCLLNGRPPNAKFNENVRKFVLTLNFYSPRAYRYIRRKFDKHLPHPSTIQKWYANSCGATKSGFYDQSLQILSSHTKEMIANGTEPICSLVFDEMAIKKHIQCSHSEEKFIGTINYGFKPDCSDVPLANNALVFMLKGINFDMCLPLAYFFITTLNGD